MDLYTNIFNMIEQQKVFLICVVTTLLVLTSPGNTILTPPSNSPQHLCTEGNLKLICECTYNYKTLSVPSFQQLNVHTNIDRITIKNCQNVTIGRQSIDHLKSLRFFEISNVANLYLNAYSLEWKGYENNYHNNPYSDYQPRAPSLSITISRTRIVNIDEYSIKGRPAELRFHHVEFAQIQPFAFSSLTKMLLFQIQNCTFRQIYSQAFKKIETDRFVISDSHFYGTLPSRSFTDIDVHEEFQILNSNFQIIDSSGFIVNLPKSVAITNSRFDTLHSEAFRVRTRGLVAIKGNVFRNLNENAFNAFSYMKEHRAVANQEIIFDYNTVFELKRQFLNFNRTSFNPKYGLIIINQTCNCFDVDIWISNNEFKEYVHCIVAVAVDNNRKYETKKALDFKGSNCGTGTSTWIILVAVFTALFVLLMIVAVVIVLFYRRYKHNKQKEYVNRGRNKNGSVGLIVPDGRTYRETEVHVIVEKAELLTTEL